MARARLQLDQAAIAAMRTRGEVYDAVTRAAMAVERGAKAQVGVGIGKLKAQTRVQPAQITSTGVWRRVESEPDYGIYHHDGRGPVVPRRAKVLAFRVKGKQVFAMRVRGVAPNRYLSDPLGKLTVNDWGAA